jgi:hypothetical protein
MIFIKNCFLFTVGSVLHKTVHKWVEKFFQEFSKIADDAPPGAEMAETTVKNFYAAGFIALVKGLDKCISVPGGYVEK